MRVGWVGVWVAGSLWGCATVPRAVDVTPTPPNTSGMVRIITTRTIGSGCPVGAHLVATAQHVVRAEAGSWLAATWSSLAGETGSAKLAALDQRRDVALLSTDRALSRVYPVATEAPQPGDRVWITGFRGPLAPLETAVPIERIVGAHVVLKGGLGPGSSGGCVLNARGEVVGIIHWQIRTESGSVWTVASALWLDWADWGSPWWVWLDQP